MKTQADKLRKMMGIDDVKQSKKTRFIILTSGKGGVGKSTISANIAHLFSKYGLKVGLFDADIGLANLDIMFNKKVNKNLLHVLKGEAEINDIVIPINDNLWLIPGASGEEIFKYADADLFARVMQGCNILNDLDLFIIDTGAGISERIQMFMRSADDLLVITMPDPSAITDAYATIKIASKNIKNIGIILNQVSSRKEAMSVFEKIKKVATLNLDPSLTLEYIGKMNIDPNIAKSVKQRLLFAKEFPSSASSKDLERIAKQISKKLERNVLVPKEESGLNGFMRRLMENF